jgi:hypothetical protein
MILVECYGDEALMKYCGYSIVEHNHGSGNIARRLEKENTKVLTALTDKDSGKTIPKYFQSLKLLHSSYAVEMFKDETRNHKVIKIEPDLEGWLMKVLDDTKTKDLLKKHKIPETKNGLHEFLMNEKGAKKLPALLTEVEAKGKSERLSALRKALESD